MRKKTTTQPFLPYKTQQLPKHWTKEELAEVMEKIEKTDYEPTILDFSDLEEKAGEENPLRSANNTPN